jgi:hypothetical protein
MLPFPGKNCLEAAMDRRAAEQTAKDAVVTVRNEYRWVGESRLGQFHIYKDGRRIGVVGAQGKMEIRLIPGASNRFQVRFWHWFRSNDIEVTLGESEHRTLVADIDRSVGVLARMGRMCLSPRSCLTLRLAG